MTASPSMPFHHARASADVQAVRHRSLAAGPGQAYNQLYPSPSSFSPPLNIVKNLHALPLRAVPDEANELNPRKPVFRMRRKPSDAHSRASSDQLRRSSSGRQRKPSATIAPDGSPFPDSGAPGGHSRMRSGSGPTSPPAVSASMPLDAMSKKNCRVSATSAVPHPSAFDPDPSQANRIGSSIGASALRRTASNGADPAAVHAPQGNGYDDPNRSPPSKSESLPPPNQVYKGKRNSNLILQDLPVPPLPPLPTNLDSRSPALAHSPSSGAFTGADTSVPHSGGSFGPYSPTTSVGGSDAQPQLLSASMQKTPPPSAWKGRAALNLEEASASMDSLSSRLSGSAADSSVASPAAASGPGQVGPSMAGTTGATAPNAGSNVSHRAASGSSHPGAAMYSSGPSTARSSADSVSIPDGSLNRSHIGSTKRASHQSPRIATK